MTPRKLLPEEVPNPPLCVRSFLRGGASRSVMDLGPAHPPARPPQKALPTLSPPNNTQLGSLPLLSAPLSADSVVPAGDEAGEELPVPFGSVGPAITPLLPPGTPGLRGPHCSDFPAWLGEATQERFPTCLPRCEGEQGEVQGTRNP